MARAGGGLIERGYLTRSSTDNGYWWRDLVYYILYDFGPA